MKLGFLSILISSTIASVLFADSMDVKKLRPFKKLILKGNVFLIWQPSKHKNVLLSKRKNWQKGVEVTQVNQTLTINSTGAEGREIPRTDKLLGKEVIKLTLTAPAFSSLSLFDTTNFEAERLNVKDFEIELHNSSDASIAGSFNDLKVLAEDSSDLFLLGKCKKKLQAKSRGTSMINSEKMSSGHVEAVLEDASTGLFWADSSIKLEAKDVSEAFYKNRTVGSKLTKIQVGKFTKTF